MRTKKMIMMVLISSWTSRTTLFAWVVLTAASLFAARTSWTTVYSYNFERHDCSECGGDECYDFELLLNPKPGSYKLLVEEYMECRWFA